MRKHRVYCSSVQINQHNVYDRHKCWMFKWKPVTNFRNMVISQVFSPPLNDLCRQHANVKLVKRFAIGIQQYSNSIVIYSDRWWVWFEQSNWWTNTRKLIWSILQNFGHGCDFLMHLYMYIHINIFISFYLITLVNVSTHLSQRLGCWLHLFIIIHAFVCVISMTVFDLCQSMCYVLHHRFKWNINHTIIYQVATIIRIYSNG